MSDQLRGGTTIGGYLAIHQGNFRSTLKDYTSIDLTGDITGSANFDVSGNLSITTSANISPTLTLNGGVSGSATFTNLGNASLTVTIADDSHNHIISNVDGLQGALNLKAPLASPSLTGTPTAPTATAGTNNTQIATTAYADTAVANLVASAPGTLDTLNELAAALGDDPDFATTVSGNIATKVSKTGVQALHDTDALRISGHTVSLYKGDGTYESVTIPDNNTWRDIDDVPVDGVTTQSISSNWAFDHNAGTGNGKHVPAIGTSGQFLAYNGTWATPSYYTDSDAMSAINGDVDHGSTASHNYYTDSDAISAINGDVDHGSTASHNYYTDSDVDDHLSGLTGITYASGNISISSIVMRSDSNSLGEITVSDDLDQIVLYDGGTAKTISKLNLFSSFQDERYVFNIYKEEIEASANQTIFNLANGSYITGANRVSVYIWGIKQPLSAFEETDSTTVTLYEGVSAGTRVLIEYIQATNIQDYIHASTHFTGGIDEITPSDIGASAEGHTHGSINNVATNTILGRNDAGTGVVEQLTPTEVKVMLNLNEDYYTETESDNRFVNVAGDSMTGALTINDNVTNILSLYNTDTSGYAGINFSTQSSQSANINYTHLDTQSYGNTNAFIFEGTETSLGVVFKDASLLPSVDNTGAIGNSTYTWNSAHIASVTGSLIGNADTASKLANARTISLTGAVTGSTSFDGSGNVSITTTAASDPTLTLDGDVSGSTTFTNLENATLTVTINNDSHTHDTRYYTETESNDRFVNVAGDSMTGDLTIDGTLYATSKSFRIPHPTKPGKKLTYGVPEGPEHSVYIRGRIKNNYIKLPDYWKKLIDLETITVQLTPFGKQQKLVITEINEHFIKIKNKKMFSNFIDCFYFIQAERKDIDKLEVES